MQNQTDKEQVDYMKIIDNNCRQFVEVLASKAPVPGGGGAAALAGAIGAALGNMVGALTTGKKKYVEAEPEVKDIMKKLDRIQSELLELVDADAEVFAPLAAAYSLPSENEGEKLHKAEELERCSKEACRVPLSIMTCCCEAIDLAARISEIGSRLALSDAGCSAAILRGALQSASLNIFINTKNMADRAFADEINTKAENMLSEYTVRADNIFTEVRSQVFC
ncbi:MAG: cyclodeaminase/cyclohydrolase family protein [Parasporobacterium sp.]|nr:cyclodeaminase/cyclohydrolase family protein [Parasporobacterium sp.]